jgi:predicted Zn finger-like uncharacterized protein
VKFLCEQCKAKYQIADEKVAGKTVRMKCRKCGHLIEVRAAVVETSTAAPPPHREPGAPSPAARALKPPTPSGNDRPGATASRSASEPRGQAAGPQVAGAARAAAPTGKAASTESAGALEGAFKNVVRSEASTTAGPRRGPREEGSAPFDMADLPSNDEWYVGINGVPVGPIRVAEVRRKAALGAVTEDSLVWQEGLDEWRPLKSFPELAASVREAMSRLSRPPAGERRSSIPPPPPPSRTSPRPPLGGAARGSIPARTLPAPSRSNVVPIMSRLATAERLEEPKLERTSPVPSPPAQPLPSPLVVSDPFASAPASFVAPHGPAEAAAVSAAPPPSAKKSPPWIQLAMIAAAIAFGITTAVVVVPVFLARPASPQPALASAATAAAAPAATASASPAAPATDVPEQVVNSTTIVATKTRGSGGPKAAATEGSQNPGRSLDLHALAQNAPTIAPGEEPAGDGPKAAGQCFSEGQVQQVIGLHQVAIRRACWERNPTAKLTVNVSVLMTIGPDGSAQSVTANGDEPSVAKCIENDVRGWRFPAMGCSQKTNFSLKFVRQ